MPTHEPDVDGHVYDAVALCVEHDLQHTLDALGVVSYHNKENSDYLACGANYPHQAIKGGYFVFVWRVGT